MLGKLKLVVLFIILIHAPDTFAATPTISSVSGTISSGQTITIAGANMVDENKTDWGSAYRTGTKYGFEGSSYSADGYGEAPDMNPQERAYDSDVYLMGAKSYRGRIYGNSSSCPTDNHSSGLYTTLSSDGVSGQDIYVRLYSRWKSTGSGSKWPTSHIKMLDVQGTGAQLYLQPAAGGSLPNQMNMVYGGANHLYPVSNFLQEDRWYCMEARFKWSSPSNFTAWVDGVQLASVNDVSVGSYLYVLFNIINACGFTNLDLTNWTDAFTISTNRVYPASQIWISNSSTFSTATAVQQEPVYLSDSSVQAKVNLSGLNADPLYLFVTNNRQETNAAYTLTGGGGDTESPSVTISTTNPSSTASDSLAVTGTSSDNVDVTQCKYRIGAAPTAVIGTTCTGEESWSCSTSGYSQGANTLYVGCSDAVGNWGSNSIVVNYTPPASLIWTETFNDSNFAARGWEDDYGDVWVDTSTKQAGAASWRQTWNNGATNVRNSANNDTVTSIRKVIGNEDEIYLEWYWYLNSDYVGSGVSYHPHLIILVDSLWENLAAGDLGAYLELAQRDLRFIVRRGSGYEEWHNTGYTLPLSSWKKIGAYLKMNTVGQSDGIVRLFVDGLQVYSAPQTQTIWMDELTIYDGIPSTPTLTIPGGVTISGARVE